MALDAAGKLYETAKALRNIDLKLETAKFKDSMADLLNQAADLKVTISDLTNENRLLEEEINSFKQRKNIRVKLHLVNGYYKLDEETEGFKFGNYCSSCFEKAGLMIPLTSPLEVLTCPSCKAHYE